MSPDEWAPLLERLRLAWPGEISDERGKLYFEALEGLDAVDVRRGVEEAVRLDRETPPPPGVLRGMSQERAPEQEPGSMGTGSRRVPFLLGTLAVALIAFGGFWTYWEGRYPDYPPDLDCAEIGHQVRVGSDDPHGLDADDDGVGCEVERPTWQGLALIGYLGGAGLGALAFVSYRRLD